MKIHTKTIIDMTTDEVVYDESFEYEGPMALAIPLAIVGAVASITGQLAGAGLLGTTALGLAQTAVIGGISAGTLLTAGGLVASTVGTTAGAAIQQNQAAKANIEKANVEKEQIMATAEERSRRRLAAGNRDISTAIAKLGRSGGDITGSLDLLMEEAANVKLGALDEIYAGKVSSSSKEYEAKLERFRAGGSVVSSIARNSRTILGATEQLGTYIGGRKVPTSNP